MRQAGIRLAGRCMCVFGGVPDVLVAAVLVTANDMATVSVGTVSVATRRGRR